jgi:hypothetical protein
MRIPTVCLLALTVATSAWAQSDKSVEHTVSVGGAVKNKLALTSAVPAGLERVRRIVKVGDATGRYRWTLEVEGVSLAALLDHVVVEKKHDDGFSRPLDTLVVVTGRNGERAMMSWGEVFAGRDPNAFVLAPTLRPYLPHHHEEVDWSAFDARAWRGIPARETLKIESCAACHDGKDKLAPITLPRGWCLVVPGDRWPARFVEDVESVKVIQVVGPVAAGTPAGKRKAVRVEVPTLVGVDGTKSPLTAVLLTTLPRVAYRDTAIGMGRGFHGTRTWQGGALAELIRPLVPKGVSPLEVYVLLSGSDDYRAVLSGAELFGSPLSGNVVLVNREDDKPLEAEAGRYKVVVISDFFVDRSVRSLAEIRVGVVK